MFIAIARFFTRLGGCGYTVVRIPSTVIGSDSRKVVAILFSDETGVSGEVREDVMQVHAEQAAELCGEGSLAMDALRLSQGEPLAMAT